MKPSKYLDDLVFMDMLEALRLGQMTRAQICEELGISAVQLSQHIGYVGWRDKLRHAKASRTLPHAFVENPDNAKAYAPAVAEVMQGTQKTLAQIAREHNLHYQVLYKRVNQAKRNAAVPA